MREIEGEGPETIAAEFAVVPGYVGLPENWRLVLPDVGHADLYLLSQKMSPTPDGRMLHTETSCRETGGLRSAPQCFVARWQSE